MIVCVCVCVCVWVCGCVGVVYVKLSVNHSRVTH